ncbi:MAG: hypothetical protein GY838_15700 [bacterium]|nr:hypothetical protein [bacterium]
MRVHPFARVLLVLFVLVTLVPALPATGRTPYKPQVDVREGDPGDGVLSPRATSFDAPVKQPETTSLAASTLESTPGMAPASTRPVFLDFTLGINTPWGFVPLSCLVPEGGWHHAR